MEKKERRGRVRRGKESKRMGRGSREYLRSDRGEDAADHVRHW